ncbi:unnamed protein product [Prorocentrum cordatum]|uniref:LamG-like jellyroll fold domain-containing protein n=1 Tax=Prorocentrum cordatum TaxID=2364126 RepID=A0ABN9TJE0_9DINO|nr:unnamed protein product [Polarella glacialis]
MLLWMDMRAHNPFTYGRSYLIYFRPNGQGALYVDSDNTIKFNSMYGNWQGEASWERSFAYAPAFDTWVHFAIVSDPSGTRLFKDGTLLYEALASSCGTSYSTALVDKAVIGSYFGSVGNSGSYFLDASIDDLQFYRSALSAQEVHDICAATPAPTPAPIPAPLTADPTPHPTAFPTPYPTAFPTPYPTAFPTADPTSYPTAFPTPYPTASSPKAVPATVSSAVGDPHLQNIHGERFDLMKTGRHVLIHIPRRDDKNTLLRVDGDVQRLGGQCADIYPGFPRAEHHRVVGECETRWRFSLQRSGHRLPPPPLGQVRDRPCEGRPRAHTTGL